MVNITNVVLHLVTELSFRGIVSHLFPGQSPPSLLFQRDRSWNTMGMYLLLLFKWIGSPSERMHVRYYDDGEAFEILLNSVESSSRKMQRRQIPIQDIVLV